MDEGRGGGPKGPKGPKGAAASMTFMHARDDGERCADGDVTEVPGRRAYWDPSRRCWVQ